MTAAQAMLSYWRHADDRAERLRPVYAVMREEDGAVLTWSVSKRAAEREATKYDVDIHGPTHIVRMVPV